MAGLSPTQLTLRDLRRRGYTAAIVEKWNPHARIRQDLYGIIDVLAVGRDETVGVQCTTAGNVPNRVAKISDHENTPYLREAGWTLLIHGWAKKNGKWTLREVDLS